jgi:hypothetical protein
MTLSVQLLDSRDITVTDAEMGFSLTYRKDGKAPLLIAVESLSRTPSLIELDFWAKAWRAAHQKALSIGWLRS